MSVRRNVNTGNVLKIGRSYVSWGKRQYWWHFENRS